MKYLYFSLFFVFLFSCSEPAGREQEQIGQTEIDLFPEIEPYHTGYLKVSDIHELYYEEAGNAEGKPVFMLHGGPGGGCAPVMRQFFNPKVYHIVLFDQRGAKRSKPYAEIEDNNTQALIEDIEKLRKHLGIDKMMLVGGSWGSTLALAYAEAYPERVTEMVLRGIWTATRAEVDHFYHGGTYTNYPDAYDELLRSLPDPSVRPLPPYLLQLLTGEDSIMREKISKAWLKYEWRISDVNLDPNEISQWLKFNNPYAFSLIENHYMAHNCFLEERQLWNNIDQISHIPTIIINGRFDMPCPVKTAWELHQSLPRSELVIVENAGHGGEAIIKETVRAIRQFETE